jgi:hypothetical protein
LLAKIGGLIEQRTGERYSKSGVHRPLHLDAMFAIIYLLGT